MNLHSLSRMPFSSSTGWPELALLDKEVAKVFATLVVPLSALPPAMVAYAGMTYGNGLADSSWALFALGFFLVEICSVSLMSWLIEATAKAHDETITYRNAYLLAAIAPVPLWLSSLALFAPGLMFNATASLIALGLSGGLIYHGVHSFCHVKEAAHATAIARIVFGVGLLAWATLMGLLIYLAGITLVPGVAIIGL